MVDASIDAFYDSEQQPERLVWARPGGKGISGGGTVGLEDLARIADNLAGALQDAGTHADTLAQTLWDALATGQIAGAGSPEMRGWETNLLTQTNSLTQLVEIFGYQRICR